MSESININGVRYVPEHEIARLTAERDEARAERDRIRKGVRPSALTEALKELVSEIRRVEYATYPGPIRGEINKLANRAYELQMLSSLRKDTEYLAARPSSEDNTDAVNAARKVE